MGKTISGKASYRSIVKGTTIFGGVQILNILINILRGKFVALFLGPVGMGVSALLTSSMNTMVQFSSFGLNLSAVKEISQAHEKEEWDRLSRVVRIFRKLVVLSALFGGVCTIAGSPWLSELSFGNSSYIWSFVLLSLMLFFTILSNGEMALLQGTRHLKDLAKSSAIGACVGLFVGIPLYYFLGLNGIVPAMICLAVVSYAVNRYSTRKINLQAGEITRKETWDIGKQMLSLGSVLMLASLIGTCTIYCVNIYIKNYGSIADVGFFQSASSLTNQYIGLVFSAMAVDYFPRLSAISGDNRQVREIVNHQAEIVSLIITPLIIALILSAPFVVRLLLTKEFMVIVPLLRWLALGLFFKALSFPLGYISFAKGDKKLFFWLEGILSNVIPLTFNIIGYSLWGLIGLGISFASGYFVYFILITVVTGIRYDFHFSRVFTKLFFIMFLLCISAFLVFEFLQGWYLYTALGLILLFNCLYSYTELDRRIDIKNLIKSKITDKFIPKRKSEE